MAKKILVADDEENIVFLIKRRLIKSGYEVVEANNGVDAVALAKQQRPDLIILDVMMPQMDGLQVCQVLKSDPKYQAIKIILLTARDQQKDKDLGKEVGADDYVTKPFEPDELIKRVKDLVAQ